MIIQWIVGNVGIYLYLEACRDLMFIWVCVCVCFKFLTFCEGKLFVQP